jgi:ribosomal protein L37AE/L43A
MNTATTCASGDQCPACQAGLTVTDRADTATWLCPECGWSVTLPALMGGRQ